MAMKIISVGAPVGAADMNEYFVNTKFATKPNDDSRASTATATNDPDLQLQVDANKLYLLEVHLVIYSPVGGGNFKCGFNAPAGSILYGSGFCHDPAGSGNVVLYSYDSTVNGLFTGVNAGNSNGVTGLNDTFMISGILDTAGTAGTLALKWAQSSSNGNSTTLRGGSSMLVRRVS